MENPQKLHQEFVRLGTIRLRLKNRMLAILPEIYQSGIYKKYAGSIAEYAGKYGDIAKTTVIKRLRLEENLKTLPCLKAAIEEVGIHKVALLAKIAKPENDKLFAGKVLNMSKMAVQSLARELRAGEFRAAPANELSGSARAAAGDNCALSSASETELPHCKAIPIKKKLELDNESTFLFLKLKANLGKNLSDGEFLKLILQERVSREFYRGMKKSAEVTRVKEDSEIKDGRRKVARSGEKPVEKPISAIVKSVTGDTFRVLSRARKFSMAAPLGKSVPTHYVQAAEKCEITPAKSRYIPAARKRETTAATNGKCSYPNCNSPYEIFHHTERYSQSKSHDSLVALCKIHHEFAHNNLIANETGPAQTWKLKTNNCSESEIPAADDLFLKYRARG